MLNAQRALNGIPANLTLSPALSDGCAKHTAYIALNGGGLTHSEEPAKPGYTAEGAGLAGGANDGEVLAAGPDRWDAVRTNPWIERPAAPLDDVPARGRRHGLPRRRPHELHALRPGRRRAGRRLLAARRRRHRRADARRHVARAPLQPGRPRRRLRHAGGPPIVIWRVGARADIERATLASPAVRPRSASSTRARPRLTAPPTASAARRPRAPLRGGHALHARRRLHRRPRVPHDVHDRRHCDAGAPSRPRPCRQTVDRPPRPVAHRPRAKPIGAPRVATVRFTSRTGKRVAARAGSSCRARCGSRSRAGRAR